MSISNPTVISSGVSTKSYGTGSFTTGSLTIPSNCLLIVRDALLVQGGSVDPSASMTMTASLGGISLVPAITAHGDAASWALGQATWYALVTTGGSSTFTMDCGTFFIGAYVWSVSYVTGHDTTTPIGPATISGSVAVGSNKSLTLSQAPAATSLVVAQLATDGADPTGGAPGTGWTEDSDVTNTGSTGLQSQYRPPGSTLTSVLWATVSGAKAVGEAFEILEAPSAGAAPDQPFVVGQEPATLRSYYI